MWVKNIQQWQEERGNIQPCRMRVVWECFHREQSSATEKEGSNPKYQVGKWSHPLSGFFPSRVTHQTKTLLSALNWNIRSTHDTSFLGENNLLHLNISKTEQVVRGCPSLNPPMINNDTVEMAESFKHLGFTRDKKLNDTQCSQLAACYIVKRKKSLMLIGWMFTGYQQCTGSGQLLTTVRRWHVSCSNLHKHWVDMKLFTSLLLMFMFNWHHWSVFLHTQ